MSQAKLCCIQYWFQNNIQMYEIVAERERSSRLMTSGYFSKLQCRESNLYIQNFRFEKRQKKPLKIFLLVLSSHIVLCLRHL